MAIWDKATYTAAYRISPRGVYTYPNGKTEPRRFTEIKLHYHPKVMKDYTTKRLDNILKKYSFTSTDKVLVFGAGFGWLCEELESRFGCATIGLDNSPYILDNKSLSPNDELLEAITGANLTITEDPGKQIWEQFSDSNPRSIANVQNIDLTSNKDRNALIRDFGTPTHIITEEVWQLLTLAEQDQFTAIFSDLGSTVIHVIDGVVI